MLIQSDILNYQLIELSFTEEIIELNKLNRFILYLKVTISIVDDL